MNYTTAIELAHQRMREIGKAPCQYHIDVLSIVGTGAERLSGNIKFHAYNEYLYLIDYQNYSGFIIISDSAFFNTDDYTENTKLQEFTGEILIIKTGATWSIDPTPVPPDPSPDGSPPPPASTKKIPVDFLRVVIH